MFSRSEIFSGRKWCCNQGADLSVDSAYVMRDLMHGLNWCQAQSQSASNTSRQIIDELGVIKQT